MIRVHVDRRVVVTGIGVMTAIGRTVDPFWKALSQSPRLEDPAPHPSAGAVADFQGAIDDFGDLAAPVRKSLRKALKTMNRETQLGVAAGQQALADSRVQQYYEPERIGVCFGAQQVSVMPRDFVAGIEVCSDEHQQFDFSRWGAEGIPQVEPLWILRCLPNMPACYLAIMNDLRGHCNTITQRDVAANLAVAEGCYVIQDGEADAVVVGASGTTLHPFNRVHARLDGELSDKEVNGETVCRPFDLRRVGPPPGEGAGALVLEEMNAALAREATIYGEIQGTASSISSIGGCFENCRRALGQVLQQVLERAQWAPGDVGHLHVHGLGTRVSDIAEARAIRDVFGEDARHHPRLVAAKSHLGNIGTGSGAVEIIASLLALQHHRLFPTRHYEEPDPECRVQPVTSRDEEAGACFLNANIALRGLASCIAVSAFDG